MQRAGGNGRAISGNAQGKQDQGNRRRQRKASPGRQRARVSGPGQPQRDADLAARRPRQELAQCNQIRVAAFAQPAPSRDELIAKVAQVRNRAAERGQPEAQEDQKHRPRTAAVIAMSVEHVFAFLINGSG
ncbi:hypothetical protein D3C87_1705520 [compost metagenome]